MNRKGLNSPPPWLAAGMGLVVGLVCLLLGAGDSFALWLKGSYAANGFPEMRDFGPSSLFSLAVLIATTFGTVFALEGTPGAGRRVMFLLSVMVVVATASPVLALWGAFWNPMVTLISIFWAGVAAMLHAFTREKAIESQQVAKGI